MLESLGCKLGSIAGKHVLLTNILNTGTVLLKDIRSSQYVSAFFIGPLSSRKHDYNNKLLSLPLGIVSPFVTPVLCYFDVGRVALCILWSVHQMFIVQKVTLLKTLYFKQIVEIEFYSS